MGNVSEWRPTTVEVVYEYGGVKFVYRTEMPWDADAMDWLTWFRKLLLVLEFHPDTVDDVAPIEEKVGEEEDKEESDEETG